MKNLLFTGLAILMTTIGFGQSKQLNGTTNTSLSTISDLGITVDVDSAEEVESTFKMEDMKEILSEMKNDEKVTFELICHYSTNPEKRINRKVSYKIEGNSNNPQAFLKLIDKIRTSAINFYKNQN